MGWGISIDQDENGFVYCHDADFETGPEDYDGCPPCSYDTIYEGVEAYHSEIDWARDEQGLDAARAQAWEAFAEAKGQWRRTSAEEQWKIHGEWMAQKRAEIKALEERLARKRAEHAELRAPLTKLEAEYAQITQPDRDKKELQELVDLEKEWARRR